MEHTEQYLKNFSEWRSQKAKAILEKGNPEVVDDYSYLVPSQFSDKKYLVTYFDTYSCNCPDFQHRCKGQGLYCKHIKTILLFKKLKEQTQTMSKEIELVLDTPQQDVCPYCSHSEIFKRGQRKTKLGVKQLFCCKSCKKRFVLEPIKNIKGNSKFVCLAMDCYYKGLSYRDISDQFSQFYGLSISHVTIRDWVLKFGSIMEKCSEKIQPNIKGIWNADETLVLTKEGKNKENTNYHYVWNVMDNKTKFLLASECSGRSRSSKDAQHVFTEAWKQNGKMPNQIIVDGYKGYEDGCRKTFRNWAGERKVKFTSIKGQRKHVNNNAIESHHSHQKEFHKIRRGITHVQEYQDGFKVFHNYIRKSVRKKLTPAEKCGIGVNGNRWNTLLVNSIKQQKATSLTAEEKFNESH